MKMRALILAVAACCMLAGCASAGDNKSGEQTATASAQQTVAGAGQPINKYCPINRTEQVDPGVTTIYKGQVIAFCCDDCIPKFKQDPEKYMKDLK